MKLNPKIFKSLTNEPFEVQEINGTTVAFHDMNETGYLAQYASRGKFAIWTSDGSNAYKVLIEKSYYDALKPFYEYEVNKIWLDFLTKAGNITKKINMYFMVPIMTIYLAIAFTSVFLWADYVIQILLGLLVFVFIANMFQTRVTSNKVRQENMNAQTEIKKTLGEAFFDDLVVRQEEHYKQYFKFEDDQVEQNDKGEVTTEDQVTEVLENKGNE